MNHLLSKNMQWNYASFTWHLLYRSTTENKNFVKLLTICQTIDISLCAARKIIFQRGNLNHLIVCFTQCTLYFFQKGCFLLPICLPCVICGSYVTKINAVLWHGVRRTFASLGLFTFACIACPLQLRIKTMNEWTNRVSSFNRRPLRTFVQRWDQTVHALTNWDY